MTTRGAKRFAEWNYAGVSDRYGEPLLAHVRRVAAAVPREARTVAWLHETLECTPVSADELLSAGATPDEVNAVTLLTRDADADVDPDGYLAHLAHIAQAPGRAGELARIVKRADLQDRLAHEDTRASATIARPPYLTALALLTAADR